MAKTISFAETVKASWWFKMLENEGFKPEMEFVEGQDYVYKIVGEIVPQVVMYAIAKKLNDHVYHYEGIVSFAESFK